MDFLETVRRRRSVRAFRPMDVDPETLSTLLSCVRRAPSAGNLQAFQLVVARSRAARDALCAAALGQRHVAEAPLVLVFFAEPERASSVYGRRGAELYALQDATIACAHAELAATALGLAACWVGAFRPDDVRRAAAAPDGWVPVALLPVGHAAEAPAPTPRRLLAEWVKEV